METQNYTVFQVCQMLHLALRGKSRPRWAEIQRAKHALYMSDVLDEAVHRRAIVAIGLLPKTSKAIRRYVTWAFTGVSLHGLHNEARHMSPTNQVAYGYRTA